LARRSALGTKGNQTPETGAESPEKSPKRSALRSASRIVPLGQGRQIEKEEETHGRQDMALQAQSADAEIATQAQAEKADGEGTDLISLS
jgi:hypothetical protein